MSQIRIGEPLPNDVLVYPGLTDYTVNIEGYNDKAESVFLMEVRTSWVDNDLIQRLRTLLISRAPVRKGRHLTLVGDRRRTKPEKPKRS